MLSTDLQISGAGLTCRVCVCLCALSHLFTACGAQTNRTERWLTASLVWLLISGEWAPWVLSVSQSNLRLYVSQSYSVGALCQPIMRRCPVCHLPRPSCHGYRLGPCWRMFALSSSRRWPFHHQSLSSLNPTLCLFIFFLFIVYCSVSCAQHKPIYTMFFSNESSTLVPW